MHLKKINSNFFPTVKLVILTAEDTTNQLTTDKITSDDMNACILTAFSYPKRRGCHR
jgi:hypothetical protein